MDRTEYSRSSVEDASTLPSPVTSVFSKGHMSKSSTSSLSVPPSPHLRDSFDLYGSKLGKVTEEQEKDDQARDHFAAPSPSICADYSLYFASEPEPLPASTPYEQLPYTSIEDATSSQTSFDHSHSKRQRSSDNVGAKLHRRLSSRFGSMSRRLKNRSSMNPPLSIITHMSAPASRAGSTSSANIISPAVSAISKHESYLPSPAQELMDDAPYSAFPDEDEDMEEFPSEPIQATTPLLPPVLTETSRTEEPVQSPLQSPSIAPTPAVLSSRTSSDIAGVAGLPSPPLSKRPSMVSIQQRSRANTATAPIAEIPPLQLVDEDPWSSALGHANFSIHPEPYLPSIFTLDAYTEFRGNWDHARRNYAKHLARTNEHYGPTSKVYKLTEEKWALIDTSWKDYHNAMTDSLGPELKRASDHSSQYSQRSIPLEKPISRIVMPEIDDKCGKFPELGDGEIVGPMEVAPPRSAAASPTLTPTSPGKRTLFRFLSDMLSKP